MLFWNNDIKAVVVVGTSIADNELQPGYTVGILPNSPYTMSLGVCGGTFKRLVCGPFLFTRGP